MSSKIGNTEFKRELALIPGASLLASVIPVPVAMSVWAFVLPLPREAIVSKALWAYKHSLSGTGEELSYSCLIPSLIVKSNIEVIFGSRGNTTVRPYPAFQLSATLTTRHCKVHCPYAYGLRTLLLISSPQTISLKVLSPMTRHSYQILRRLKINRTKHGAALAGLTIDVSRSTAQSLDDASNLQSETCQNFRQ